MRIFPFRLVRPDADVPSDSYLVHSAFTLMLPLHLLYLTSILGYTRSALLKGLSIAMTEHLSSFGTPTDASSFPYFSLARVVLLLFFGLTCPALLWFAAVSLASCVIFIPFMDDTNHVLKVK